MKMIHLFTVAAAWLINLTAAEKPDLAGKVTEPSGQGIANASVFIYTAGPRVGPGYI